MLLKARKPAADGCVAEVTPRTAGWTYVGFKACVLQPGASMKGGEAGRETCIVVISGTATIRSGARTYEDVGSRASVFEDAAPGAVYLPAGTGFEVVGKTRAEVAVCSAPGIAGPRERRIDPASMSRETRGSGTNTRHVRNILPQGEEATSLLVVEVVTPGGHWSSYPPHKHDTDSGSEETALEETYYHRLDPPQGFAFQRVYTDDRSIDQTHCVEDGDVVTVPRGYHPVGAPHGYDLY